MKETVVGYIDTDDYASFTSAEKKWINKILKLKAEHPDKVDIKAYPENNQGYIYSFCGKNNRYLHFSRKNAYCMGRFSL